LEILTKRQRHKGLGNTVKECGTSAERQNNHFLKSISNKEGKGLGK